MKGTAVKKIIIAGALLLGCAGVASAAGAEPTSGNQSPYDWSGSYIGLHLGYGWGDSTFVDNEYNGVGTFPEVKWRPLQHSLRPLDPYPQTRRELQILSISQGCQSLPM